ncbi:MAG: 50S ribosomal protein L29 [Candidatus Sericytochromatia bacterium]|nr:50S ribosomal protein L29 [Candidatus Sericytochromatia bacterium]
MKAEEIKKMDKNQLIAEREKLLKLQFNLRMQRGSGQLGQPHLMRAARKDIARINTALTELKGQDDGN